MQSRTEQNQSALQAQGMFSSTTTQTTSTTSGPIQSNPVTVDNSPYNGKDHTTTPVTHSRFR